MVSRLFSSYCHLWSNVHILVAHFSANSVLITLIWFMGMILVHPRSCNTLQMAMDLVNKQHPLKGKTADEDTASQATTLPILGNRIKHGFFNSTHGFLYH